VERVRYPQIVKHLPSVQYPTYTMNEKVTMDEKVMRSRKEGREMKKEGKCRHSLKKGESVLKFSP
jgi:hypothetical protein